MGSRNFRSTEKPGKIFWTLIILQCPINVKYTFKANTILYEYR